MEKSQKATVREETAASDSKGPPDSESEEPTAGSGTRDENDWKTVRKKKKKRTVLVRTDQIP